MCFNPCSKIQKCCRGKLKPLLPFYNEGSISCCRNSLEKVSYVFSETFKDLLQASLSLAVGTVSMALTENYVEYYDNPISPLKGSTKKYAPYVAAVVASALALRVTKMAPRIIQCISTTSLSGPKQE